MIENIFFSFSFSEFKPLVELITKRISESVTLQKCGLRPHHLAKLEAYKDAPLENSLLQVRNSRYMVCLLGQNAGSTVENGKTYIECEIEAALENDVDVFAFLIGENYQDPDYLPEEIAQLHNKLASHITIGRLATDDYESLARKISRTLESDVWQTLGEDEKYTISADLLNVSGFPREHLNRLPSELSQQLSTIYAQDDPACTCSPIAADIAQRKYWAYQSLNYGHTDEAIKSLQKVENEFGSDFFSCFWLGRLYAMHASRDQQLKKGRVMAERARTMLGENDTLLSSLCNTHLGIVFAKLGDIEAATEHFTTAEENFKTYDVYEHKADMCLQQMQKSAAGDWVKLATESLAYIQRSKLSYFIQVHAKFEDKYGASFTAVANQLNSKWKKFVQATYNATVEDQAWAATNFEFKPAKLPTLQTHTEVLGGVFLASQLIWQNYRALRFSAKKIQQRYLQCHQRQMDLDIRREDFQTNYMAVLGFIEQCRELIAVKTEVSLKKQALNKKLQKVRKKNRFIETGVALFAIGLAAFAAVFANIPLTYIAVFVVLVGVITYSSLAQPIKQISLKIDDQINQESSIDAQLLSLSEALDASIANEQLKLPLAGLTNELDFFNETALDDAQRATHEYHEINRQRLNSEEMVNEKQLYTLSEQVSAWYTKVDRFEQYAVSAHNGQYSHLLCRKGRVKVAKKLDLGTDSLRFVIDNDQSNDNIRGRALHIDGSRLKAWFDDVDGASAMLVALEALS